MTLELFRLPRLYNRRFVLLSKKLNKKNMGIQDFKIKPFIAIFVIVFCLSALVFGNVSDMVLGALIGYISAILQYFFGSSTGSTAKDKVIQDMGKNTSTDVTMIAENIGLPKPKEPRK